jgi:hypothetical protein
VCMACVDVSIGVVAEPTMRAPRGGTGRSGSTTHLQLLTDLRKCAGIVCPRKYVAVAFVFFPVEPRATPTRRP